MRFRKKYDIEYKQISDEYDEKINSAEEDLHKYPKIHAAISQLGTFNSSYEYMNLFEENFLQFQ